MPLVKKNLSCRIDVSRCTGGAAETLRHLNMVTVVGAAHHAHSLLCRASSWRCREVLDHLQPPSILGRCRVSASTFDSSFGAWPMSRNGIVARTLLSKDAQTRAIQLLKQHLTPAQREQYEKRGHFYVTGGDSGRLYRIRHGVQMNVEQLDRMGRRIHVLCFMPEGGLAIGDVMLAQKIALELFETEALQIANKMPPFLDLGQYGRRSGSLGQT